MYGLRRIEGQQQLSSRQASSLVSNQVRDLLRLSSANSASISAIRNLLRESSNFQFWLFLFSPASSFPFFLLDGLISSSPYYLGSSFLQNLDSTILSFLACDSAIYFLEGFVVLDQFCYLDSLLRAFLAQTDLCLQSRSMRFFLRWFLSFYFQRYSWEYLSGMDNILQQSFSSYLPVSLIWASISSNYAQSQVFCGLAGCVFTPYSDYFSVLLEFYTSSQMRLSSGVYNPVQIDSFIDQIYI